MYPTFAEVCIQLSSPRYKHGRGVRVGDIIVAESPYFSLSPVGKRIIGMPGDFVVYDSGQAKTVGGAAVPGDADDESRKEPLMIEVPEGHVWLAGDNLAHSRDSRTYGPLPMALIRGKIVASSNSRTWFTTKWRWFGNDEQLLVAEEAADKRKNQRLREAWRKDKGITTPSIFEANARTVK